MTDLKNLQSKIQEFCEERDWDQYHNPKELAIGLVTESAELLDLFRFKSEEQIQELFNSSKREAVEDELADIFFFLLRFSQFHGFDLTAALDKKLEKNNKKYPAELVKGKNLKYNEY